MRGKLRDKRVQTKGENFKRDLVERRRTAKRDNRPLNWQNQELEEENDLFDLIEEEEETPIIVQQKRK